MIYFWSFRHRGSRTPPASLQFILTNSSYDDLMSSSCSQDKVCAILTRSQCVFEEKSLSHSLNSKVHIND